MNSQTTPLIIPNPNNIYIPYTQVPIVILFGPPASGKTMTVARLCDFLRHRNYSVEPCRNFCNAPEYQEYCNNYLQSFGKIMPANGTLDFILLEIWDNYGKLMCYIFDAPGEFYFNPSIKDYYHPTILSKLITSENPKEYVFFVEPRFGDSTESRHTYVEIIRNILRLINYKKDKSIILYNKIDLTPFVLPDGKIASYYIKDIQNRYPYLLEAISYYGFAKFFKPYRRPILPFSTGFYSSDNKYYVKSLDIYPMKLWQTLIK